MFSQKAKEIMNENEKAVEGAAKTIFNSTVVGAGLGIGIGVSAAAYYLVVLTRTRSTTVDTGLLAIFLSPTYFAGGTAIGFLTGCFLGNLLGLEIAILQKIIDRCKAQTNEIEASQISSLERAKKQFLIAQ